MSWALTIRALRLRNGLKQAALADILGLDQATVSRWERGASEPSIGMQQKIRDRIDDFDKESCHLQTLFEEVISSPFMVTLTAPGAFTTVASSESARAYLGVGDDPYVDYDWQHHPHTSHQSYVYQMLRNGEFSCKAITKIDSTVALKMPSGNTVLNNSEYYPVWTGEPLPRMLIRIFGRKPYKGESGILVIHRVTEPPQTVVLPKA